jgi:hypothetical protein
MSVCVRSDSTGCYLSSYFDRPLYTNTDDQLYDLQSCPIDPLIEWYDATLLCVLYKRTHGPSRLKMPAILITAHSTSIPSLEKTWSPLDL